MEKGDTVVDVGANIGMFSLFCAEVCGSGGQVIACEPIPLTFEALQKNVKEQRLQADRIPEQSISLASVKVLNVGISNGSANTATFTFYPRAAGWSTMRPDEREVRWRVEFLFDSAQELQRGTILTQFWHVQVKDAVDTYTQSALPSGDGLESAPLSK